MNRKRALTHTLLGLTLGVGALFAQSPESDPFQGALYPPDLVMRHADEISLDTAQKTALKETIQQAQPLFLDRQLEMQSELGAMRRLVRADRVDEQAVLDQLDRILDLERQVKRTQIGLLVRVKNLLTTEQQQRLSVLRDKE